MRSDSASNALVASSRSKILGFFKMALAIASLCFCPPDICVPCSPTILVLRRMHSNSEMFALTT
ncbi:hypothetical protein N665_0119s0006 [Sinapis alba]|nr:hypothetical protein N665_0119s0006 [Sinapis alba]